MSGQGHPIDDRTRNRIKILATDGHKQADIARICGVSDKTVQRVRKDQTTVNDGKRRNEF